MRVDGEREVRYLTLKKREKETENELKESVCEGEKRGKDKKGTYKVRKKGDMKGERVA